MTMTMNVDSLLLAAHVLAGFVLGSGVSVFNYRILNPSLRAWVESEVPVDARKLGIPREVALRYVVRYGTSLVAIYLAYVFSGEPAVLLATGLGLLLMRNYSLMRELTRGKEG